MCTPSLLEEGVGMVRCANHAYPPRFLLCELECTLHSI